MDNYDANVSTSGKTVTITIQSNRTILDDEISLFSENDEVEFIRAARTGVSIPRRIYLKIEEFRFLK